MKTKLLAAFAAASVLALAGCSGGDEVGDVSLGLFTLKDIKGSSSKTPVTKPDGTKMFRSVFLNDARRCCFFYQHNSKILL